MLHASVLPVLPTEELEPKSLRMVILTIMLVQVLCCHLITKITRNGINGAMFVTGSEPKK